MINHPEAPLPELTQRYMDEIMSLYRERSAVNNTEPPFNRDEYDIPLSDYHEREDPPDGEDLCPDGNSCGTLVIEVTTARGDLPVPDAHVTVSSADGKTAYRFMLTDESGTTPVLTLSAPPRSLSEAPQSYEKPYAEYHVRVTADGYSPVVNKHVPVFSTVKSIQQVRLIPLPEFSGFPEEIIYEIEEEALKDTGGQL